MTGTSRAWLSRGSLLAGFAALLATPSVARAAVCYQLPFPNPNLSDGWGSTCCGRTSPHRGVDFPQGSGTAIPAVADGTVVINTWSNCLGNVIVVEHADGMFSGYSHMLVASPLGPGTPVAIGQQVGQVGDTGSCSQGAHLHLTMAPTAGGYGSGTTVDPYAYIQSHLTCNDPPTGYLDSATCDGVIGWTQDPTMPDTSIAAHVYFDGPAGDPAAIGVATTAAVVRDDLCMALGSCAHGFRVATPMSLRDGLDHAVHAYGIDGEGSGNNPELGSSPLLLNCPTPALTGAKRRIPDPAALAAWQFSTFDDLVTLEDAALAAFESTIDLPFAPRLAIPDDGSGELWLIDGVAGERRRPVPDPAIVRAWRLDIGVVDVMPSEQLMALAEAPPLRDRPILIKGSGEDLYVLDERIDPVPADDSDSDGDSNSEGSESGEAPTTSAPVDVSSSSEGSSDSSEDADADADADADEGCGCNTGAAWPGAAVLLLLAARRRRPVR